MELATYDGVDFTITNRTRTEFFDVSGDAKEGNAKLAISNPTQANHLEESRVATHLLQYSGSDICVLKDCDDYMIFHAHLLSQLSAFFFDSLGFSP